VRRTASGLLLGFALVSPILFTACGRAVERREMLVTAYCPCGECNGYTRGRWRYLKLNLWNRYVKTTGEPYDGRTASGTKLHPPHPGLLSLDTLTHPWTIPIRVLPPFILRRPGTVAADTDFYPFGTEVYVPGYGWGVVEDRGGAIRGPDRLDVLMRSHRATERWGRRHLTVEIHRE
jgi:hypothetical protein